MNVPARVEAEGYSSCLTWITSPHVTASTPRKGNFALSRYHKFITEFQQKSSLDNKTCRYHQINT